MLRVFRPTAFFDTWVFTEYGRPLKSATAAIATADRVGGYVVDISAGCRRVYESPTCPS